MFHEISKHRLFLSKFEEPSLLWENNILSIRSLKKIISLEFARDFNTFEKKIRFIESNITCNNNSPVSQTYLQNYAKKGIKNIDLTEMFIDPVLWPHNNAVMQEMNKIISFHWSPSNIILNNLNLLAIVSSCGNVDLFYSQQTHAMNFSEIVKDNLKCSETSSDPKDFDTVKHYTYSLATTAICWAPVLNEDNSCFFVTAQKSGEILFWKIKCNNTIQVEFFGSFQCTNREIDSMLWVCLNNDFFLICATTSGQIIGYECTIQEKTIKKIKENVIWEYDDKVVAKHMHFINNEDEIIFVCSKHRHVLLQLFNKNLKLLSQCVKNVNDYKITCIAKNNKDLYVGTRDAQVFNVEYNIANSCINVTINCIKFKEVYSNHDLYGLGISHNKAIFAVALIDRKVRCRKVDMMIKIVFLKFETSLEYEMNKILNNPSKQLTHSRDMLEVLKYEINKTKNMPDVDYNYLYITDDIYKIKIYLTLIIIYNNLKLNNIVNVKNQLPELSIDKVKEKILILHAANLLQSIYEKTNIIFSDFQLECINGAKTYIDYYCRNNKKDVAEFVSEDIFYKSKLKIENICQSCDDNVEGFTCKSGHLNVYCSLTFTPIISNDYLVCKNCTLVARSELLELNPKCVFCDSYLNSYESVSLNIQ